MTVPFRVVASVSGGKDSAAMCLHLRELGIPYEAVFCDTGWEHPDTYAHIRDVLEPAIGPILWLRSGGPNLSADAEGLALMFEARLGHRSAFVRWVIGKAMFPSRLRRYCTEELKVKPIARHVAPMAVDTPWHVINAVGIRAGESFARAQLPEWEASNLGTPANPMRAWTWRPLREWSDADVVAIHKRHGLPPNPLYLRGATRVGCWPCIYARKAEIALVASLTPVQIEIIADLERLLTDAAVARAVARQATPISEGLDDDAREIAEQLRDPSHWRNQRTFFGLGAKGMGWDFYDIATVVDWAQTDRGGRQYQLFGPTEEAAADGCMRWGMCEVET